MNGKLIMRFNKATKGEPGLWPCAVRLASLAAPCLNLRIQDPRMSEYHLTGSCLCENVAYKISGNLGIFQYCNCSRCRKFTGSAFASNLLVSPGDFRWLRGQDFVRRFELAETKHFATAFCNNCGSSLPWLAQTRKALVVPAGTLDGDPKFGHSKTFSVRRERSGIPSRVCCLNMTSFLQRNDEARFFQAD